MEGIALPIILLVLGAVALFLEVFVPSGGLIVVVALACTIGSVTLAFMHHGQSVGLLFLLLAVVLVPGVLITGFTLLPKTAIGRRLMLSTEQTAEDGYTAQDAREKELIGKRGTALSTLRPSGEARIDGRRYDVITEGEMIDRDSEIEVYQVTGNRIVVRRSAASENA